MAGNLSFKTEQELAEAVSRYYDNPLGFVMFAYPWGEPKLADGSTNPLAKRKGPREWQKRLLIQVGQAIKDNHLYMSWDMGKAVHRFARASGHGVGKSAVVAWLIQFFMSTRRDTRMAVTANTAGQLETKTWPELAKWHKLLINKHWFDWTATSYYFKMYPDAERKNYMANALTVSEHNTEAFAGLHNEAGSVIFIFDEASGIFRKLWEVAEGGMTDGEAFFFAFGNPTQADGEFADCFDKNAHMYNCETISSLDVALEDPTLNINQIRDIIRKYGEDSDETRVRVYGRFPRQSYNGFISKDVIDAALTRELHFDPMEALIMAVDVARYGRDSSVIRYRQGRDARSIRPVTLRQKSLIQLAEVVMHQYQLYKPDAIVVESTGIGAGLVDILRDRGYKIIEVHPGANSSVPEHWHRLRDELWGEMRDWLIDVGCIPEEPELIDQLGKIQYSLDRHSQKIRIEPKDEYMERTNSGSPDEADSLMLTFGVKLPRRDRNLDLGLGVNTDRNLAITDCDIYAV